MNKARNQQRDFARDNLVMQKYNELLSAKAYFCMSVGA